MSGIGLGFEVPSLQHGTHRCQSCERTHCEPYETWCRAERQRLHPANFVTWTEAEHPRNGVLTWAEQLAVWAHRDAWEACMDGDMSLEQTRVHVAYLDPLPDPNKVVAMMRAVARSKTARVRPVSGPKPISRDREAALLDLIRKPEPEEPAA